MTTQTRKLTRDVENQVVAGVCAGVANYLGIDRTVVRVAFVLIMVFTAFIPGILAYVIMWVMIPREEPPPATSAVTQQS